MSENEPKKDSPIRLPAALRVALKREINARFERGEPEPTFGALLSEAWAVYESSKPLAHSSQPMSEQQIASERTGKFTPPNRPSAPSSRVIEHIYGAGTHHIPNERELPWVEKAVKVLRSAKPGISVTLQQILTQLDDSATQWLIHHGGDEGSGAAGPAGAGKSPGTAGPNRGSDEIAQLADQDEQELEALQREAEKRRSSKKRAPGKTG